MTGQVFVADASGLCVGDVITLMQERVLVTGIHENYIQIEGLSWPWLLLFDIKNFVLRLFRRY